MNRCKDKERQIREQEHFDRLTETAGEIWWGSTTKAGIKPKFDS